MSKPLPGDIDAHLRGLRESVEHPVWIMLDGAGCLLDWAGPVEHYGLHGLQPGENASIRIPALTGLVNTPVTECVNLPLVEIAEGFGVALDLLPTTSGSQLMLRDVSADLRTRRTLQQLANESRLLNEQLRRTLKKLEAANAELARARSAAETASRAKSRFIASMSHELRTPLTSILGYASLLEPPAPPDPAYVHAIQRAGNHLLSMIDNVLDEGMLAADQLRLRPDTVAVEGVIDEAVDVLQERARARSIAVLHQAPAPGSMRVWADPVRLRQVLINLLDNAIKYVPEGGWVRIDTTSNAAGVTIEVADSGPGIDPALRQTLFTPFQRGADFSDVRGAGLGLAIARQIVELMQGNLELVAGPGTGAIFRITLPRARSPEQCLTGQRAALILVAEDDPNIRDLIGIHLNAAGFRVLSAGTGREAIVRALGDGPDLVLLDLNLPDMNGEAVMRRLRASTFTGSIVAITAAALRERLDAALAAGFDDYAIKPLDFPRLARQIRGLIDKHD